MPFNFTFEVDGVVQLNRSFNRVQEHIEDLRPVWEQVEREFKTIEGKQFKSEGAAGGGGKWKPLTREYAKQKAKKYPGAPILQRTARLKNALAGTTSDTVLIKTKDEFGIGTSLFYAPFHQRGTDKMAKRPVIDFGEDQNRDIQKKVQLGLLEILRRDPASASLVDFK